MLLDKHNWNWLFNLHSGSEMVEGFYSAIAALLDKYVPVKTKFHYAS